MARAILFDSTQCVGCKACEEACATKWGNPYDEKVAAEERVSSHKLTAVRTFGEHYSRKLCMHCLEPSCASVCPVGALEKTALGPVVYDESKCMGCRYCMVACPFQVPSYEWDSRLPRVKKCDGCFERQSKGQPTACTEACPTGATICGDREELIAEARKRIAENPGQYYNHIYGLEEVGGTSVLMLSAVPFEQIGMPGGLPKDALPERTWAVLSHIPDVAGLGAVLLGGVYWITHRRDEVAKAERAEASKEKENVR
ncbi:MAG: 4Fe-4S dicluster domain-containing protein [Bryobacteraceae bacterium]|nr:4Fe-4S dicluster domain-containing protein [Bryobacterales bacterium]MEB2361696.1 4Fe-4S dicluster domain-containing protein [Bryobacterales bacterium]NUN03306.1 4Fe-4S dicluster domain-containing protein [Bryobacteraceae bacterium]